VDAEPDEVAVGNDEVAVLAPGVGHVLDHDAIDDKASRPGHHAPGIGLDQLAGYPYPGLIRRRPVAGLSQPVDFDGHRRVMPC